MVPKIVQTWSGTLKDLSLPEEIGLDLDLDEDETDETDLEEFKTMISSMANLQYLHIGNWCGYLIPFDFEGNPYFEKKKHIEKLRNLFPGLTINLNPFSDDYPARTDPSYTFLNIENSYTE